MTLKFKRVAAKSGKAKSALILLHGYGADGADLISLSQAMCLDLPDTVFIAPDAPTRCAASPFGFQWFPIPWLDGSSEEDAKNKVTEISATVRDWITDMIVSEGISERNTFLLGFSQGTMLSLHIGLNCKNTFGGIVGFSGRLMENSDILSDTESRPPIILIHGDKDEVVDCKFMNEAYETLHALGYKIKTHICKGLGHGISPEGLGFALGFLKENSGGK